MKIYCISGLGADERLFKHLHLPGHELVFVPWITPAKHESIGDYAQHLISIHNMEEGCAVLGVSLGGMVATEIALRIPVAHTILISTIKTCAEAPAYYRFFRTIPVYKFLNGSAIKRLGVFFKPIMGKMAGADGHLFYLMLQTWHLISPDFL